MNEIDRIKKEGWLKDSFFSEESRCDFLVTVERKEVWAILLDLYREFKRVCDENGLFYYAIGGTLLGSVRHGGFIPWDDDIDMAMPREDYEKLKKLRSEFKSPYFLTYPGIEEENGFSYVKLRNSNTTGISFFFKNLKINQGMDLDIFPIDEANPETYVSDYDKIKSLLIENSSKMKSLSKSRDEDSDRKCNFDFQKNFEEVERIAQKDNNKGFGKVAQRTITVYPHQKLLWEKDDFKEFLDMDFETEKIRIPKGYDRILRVNYGDWSSFPSIENRGNWHSNAIFDPKTPYNSKRL